MFSFVIVQFDLNAIHSSITYFAWGYRFVEINRKDILPRRGYPFQTLGRCLRPGYPLILHRALATGPVSAITPNAGEKVSLL